MAKSRKSNRAKDTGNKSVDGQAAEVSAEELDVLNVADPGEDTPAPRTADADMAEATELSDPVTETTETLEAVDEAVTDAPVEDAPTASETEDPATEALAETPADDAVAAATEDTAEATVDEAQTEMLDIESASDTSDDMTETETPEAIDGDTDVMAEETASEPSVTAEETLDEGVEATDDEVRDKPTDEETDGATDDTVEAAPEEALAEVETQEREETPKAPPPPQPEPQVVKGSMWPGVIGGVIAAVIGFLAGHGDAINQYLPASLQRGAADLSAIEEQMAAQTSAFEAEIAQSTALIEAQAARIDALEAASATDVLDVVSGLQGDVETLASQLAALEAQPAAAPEPGVDPEEVAQLQSALADQEAQLAALTDRAATAEANAETEAARILASAALLRVVTAMDSGEPFVDALSELEAVTPVEVPAALAAAAESGVPTMAVLQDTFPDAARAALSAARSDVPDGEGATITAFLQRQLNVRSVVPRDGDDADAVLSRAQAAVRDGDISLALNELDGLPEVAGGVMTEWIEAAVARQGAKDAASALADSLSSN